jgi:UDP-glucuronate 4-epimerase
MRILITGGAGFIGSHLCDALLARGDSVTVIDNFDPHYDPAVKHRNLEGARQYDRFELVEGDIRDSELLGNVFSAAAPDAVVHLAALAGVRQSLEQPMAFNAVNIDGTLRVLEAALAHGKPRVVFASTSSVYGKSPRIPFREDDPLLHCVSPYGVTKIAGECYGHIYNSVHELPIVALRFFTAYGPRQRPDMAIHLFARAILEGRELTIFGDGSTSRDYTYIGDIIQGVVAAIDSGITWDIINLGNSEATRLDELLRLIEDACGMQARIKRLPEQAGDPPHTCADISHAAGVLGFAPRTPLAEGVQRFVDWLREDLEHAGRGPEA